MSETVVHRVRRHVALMGVVSLLSLTACGSGGGADSAGRTASPSTTAPSTAVTTASPPPTSTQPAPAERLVSRVVLAASDFTDGTPVELMPGGDKVVGEVTLDNCGFSFTTEAHRVARRQVDIGDPNDATGYSNEVVAYDTVAQAAKALNQMRASVTRCPKHRYEPSAVAGVPPLRYDVSRLRSDRSLPVKDNAIVTVVLSAKGETTQFHGVAIYLRKGAVLSAVYLQADKAPTAADMSKLRSLALITGKRLAAS